MQQATQPQTTGLRRGKSLVELATELERIKNNTRDFLVPAGKLSMNENAELCFTTPPKVQLAYQAVENHEKTVALNSWSSGQLANFTEIPKAYYDRIKKENPRLLADSVNHGLARKPTEPRMVRTVDGKVRAFVSNKFRRGLGNFELLDSNLEIMMEKGFQVQSAELTDQRLYVKAVSPKVQAEIKVGDVVNFGIVLSNSDVGAGEFRLETFIYRLSCLNGMVGAKLTSARHLQRAISSGEESMEIFSDQTLNLSDAAFFSGMRDMFLNAIKPENFDVAVNKLREASERKIYNTNLDQVVELTMNATKVRGEGIKHSILAALMSGNEGAGLTQYGLVNSFTRAAQDAALDYDTATELERAGGQIIELGAQQWKRIAESH